MKQLRRSLLIALLPAAAALAACQPTGPIVPVEPTVPTTTTTVEVVAVPGPLKCVVLDGVGPVDCSEAIR